MPQWAQGLIGVVGGAILAWAIWVTVTLTRLRQKVENGMTDDLWLNRGVRHGSIRMLIQHHARLHYLDGKHTEDLPTGTFDPPPR